MRAIDLLGKLKEDTYDELADIAANGLSRNERVNALELLAKISRKPSVREEVVQTYTKRSKKVKPETSVEQKPSPSKLTKALAKGKLTDELFKEMLHHVKPLLLSTNGCSESEIKKQFRNLKGSVVESFLTKAIVKGMIKEVMPGTFKLIIKK